MDVVVLPQGVILCKFFDAFNDIAQFSDMITAFATLVYPTTRDIIANKFLTNKSLCDDAGNLKFAASIVHVFPNLKKADIEKERRKVIDYFTQIKQRWDNGNNRQLNS